MSTPSPSFPKARALQDAELDAWKYVFQSITELQKQVQDLTNKIDSCIGKK